MEIVTEPFKGGRKNTQFKCGMYAKPYTNTNQCQKLGICLVTDDTYMRYKYDYWHIWNKHHEDDWLPMMQLKIICKDHLAQLKKLPNNPRQRSTK